MIVGRVKIADRKPEEEKEVVFFSNEGCPMYGRYRKDGRFEYVVTLDSSGEEDYDNLSDFIEWLDETESPSPDGWVKVSREVYDAVYSIRKNFELWRKRELKDGMFSFHLQNNLLTIERFVKIPPAPETKGGEG